MKVSMSGTALSLSVGVLVALMVHAAFMFTLGRVQTKGERYLEANHANLVADLGTMNEIVIHGQRLEPVAR